MNYILTPVACKNILSARFWPFHTMIVIIKSQPSRFLFFLPDMHMLQDVISVTVLWLRCTRFCNSAQLFPRQPILGFFHQVVFQHQLNHTQQCLLGCPSACWCEWPAMMRASRGRCSPNNRFWMDADCTSSGPFHQAKLRQGLKFRSFLGNSCSSDFGLLTCDGG